MQELLNFEVSGSCNTAVAVSESFLANTYIEFVSGGRAHLGNLLNFSPTGKSERLVMRGPGGRGALNVAVSAVPSMYISHHQRSVSCSLKSQKVLPQSSIRVSHLMRVLMLSIRICTVSQA